MGKVMALEFDGADISDGPCVACCLRKIHSNRGVFVFCTRSPGHSGKHSAGLTNGRAAVIWDGPEDEATAAMVAAIGLVPK